MSSAHYSTPRIIDLETPEIGDVVNIDLDDLPDPSIVELGECLGEVYNAPTWVWLKIISEYWRIGKVNLADELAKLAVKFFESTGKKSALYLVHSILANLQIAHSRTAPKLILQDAREDVLKDKKRKEEYYKDAAAHLNSADKIGVENPEVVSIEVSFLTRGIQQLATRSMDDALRSFDSVLADKKTNVVALLGKARILYARRQFAPALKIFQQVLQLNPKCKPDPRIGIGLCLWAMDHKTTAKAAWKRSLDMDRKNWVAQLLLGLEACNMGKSDALDERERAKSTVDGIKLLELAFRASNTNAAACNALFEHFIRKKEFKRALKLAERAIQYADTLTVLTEGYLRAARVCHADGHLSLATKFYTAATEGHPKHVVGAIGLAQMQMLSDEIAAAIHTLDTLLQPPNAPKNIEATVMLASLRAHPRPGVSSTDLAQERVRARELFERASKSLELDHASLANGHSAASKLTLSSAARRIGDDPELHEEMARLWQGDNLERVARSLRDALRILEATGKVDPRVLNNLGALQHLEGRYDEAVALYEKALPAADEMGGDIGEAMSTSILYNWARAFEDLGNDAQATELYEKVLRKHPEYVDAKIRLADLLVKDSRHNDAHDLIKQSLSSQKGNLNLRAYYIYFLIQSNLPKIAKDFVFATLKDHDKHDLYSLCAAGWIMYHQARETRDPKAAEERKRNFQRSAEFYEKALQIDPFCAVAAQGLAIVTAEDALGAFDPPTGDESQRRMHNARDALEVFGKVRESINDGSVYVNIGHCYHARDEFDRAIESYETASARFYKGHNPSVLMCLCRSWYAKGTKDSSFSAMNSALRYSQQALHIQPSDKSTLYNVAMVEQKAAELLFRVDKSKRTLSDLQKAIDQANHAQRLFASLADDPSRLVPYDRDIARQRVKYGEIMLRTYAARELGVQRDYEMEMQQKRAVAQQKRQEERQRQEEIQRQREEEHRRQAAEVAEERRIAREQAAEWSREVKMADSDDEVRERKPKKGARKVKTESGSGDEALEPKKRKRGGKLKKTRDENSEEPALFSDQDEEKPAKKRVPKKRVIKDEDEDVVTARPKKQFKSKEMLSDTDEEM